MQVALIIYKLIKLIIFAFSFFVIANLIWSNLVTDIPSNKTVQVQFIK